MLVVQAFMSMGVLRLSVIVLNVGLVMTDFMLHLRGTELNGLVMLSWNLVVSWCLLVCWLFFLLYVLVDWCYMFIMRLLGLSLASKRRMMDDALRRIGMSMPVAFRSSIVLYLLGIFLFLVSPYRDMFIPLPVLLGRLMMVSQSISMFLA